MRNTKFEFGVARGQRHTGVDMHGTIYAGKTFDGKDCTKVSLRTQTERQTQLEQNYIYDSMQTTAAALSRWLGDLELSAGAVFMCGGLLALLLSFGWIMILE